ncbi:MAG: hypothetical protein ACI906_005010 [Candidatus Latescibacterota bacterium]|jgi:hypothetical protein
MSTHKTMVTHIICALACVVLLSVSARAALVWDPSASTYDGTSFVVLQPGVGAVSLGFPGPANPVGTMVEAAGIQAFAFATAVPEGNAIAPGLTDLSASPLVAGTELVLYFDKEEGDHISFVALVADAAGVGLKVLSPTRIEVRAQVVDPVLSESNDPDAIAATFGMIIFTTSAADSPANFRGTVFVSDMHWLDLAPPSLDELPQTGAVLEVKGFVAGLVAQGVSAEGGQARFDAFIPESFFEFARANGVEVTGANCLGYRAYVELTGSDEGFFKLNEPVDEVFADANFDADGDGAPDPLWHYRIVNSSWSRQVLTFGRIEPDSPPAPVLPHSWGQVKKDANE